MPPSFTWARACSNRIYMEMRANSKHLLTLTLEILPALSKLLDLYRLEWPLHSAVNSVRKLRQLHRGQWQLKGSCADRADLWVGRGEPALGPGFAQKGSTSRLSPFT